MSTQRSARHRGFMAAAFIGTIALGLASRQHPALFPAALGKYPGDALWAQMVYWLLALWAPSASAVKLALGALMVSYADELSQLYQAQWIQQVRATTVGHLVLGTHFSWLDVASYTVGIGMLAPLDAWLHRPRPHTLTRAVKGR
jgi:hypothetical protein